MNVLRRYFTSTFVILMLLMVLIILMLAHFIIEYLNSNYSLASMSSQFKPDFVVKYDPSIDDIDLLTKRVLVNVLLRPLKFHFPAVIFIGGDSGHGKSLSVIKIQEILLDSIGLKLIDYLHDCNIYTPFEYPKKIEKMLYDKSMRKIKLIAFHEAREIIKAKAWASFLAQAVADVNAESRSVKPMVTFIISQFIRDITTDMRYTLKYYCTADRPLGGHTKLKIMRMWKDDRDLEKPKLRKARLKGVLIYPNGKRRVWYPKYLELALPSKEVVEAFEKADTEAKSSILKAKLKKLMKEMQEELDVETDKVPAMVEFYLRNPDKLELVGHYVRGKFKVKPDIMTMHDLSKEEAVSFGLLLTKSLKEKGIIQSPTAEEGTLSEIAASQGQPVSTNIDSQSSSAGPGDTAEPDLEDSKDKDTEVVK